MRKILLAAAAAVIGLGISGAMADVTVVANITKTKNITIFEDLFVQKHVLLDVFVNSTPEKFAESVTLINQSNDNNEGCGNCAEKTDTLFNSGNNNAGLLSINEASGNMMNQANAISASIDVRNVGGGDGGPGDEIIEDGAGFAESQAGVSQINGMSNAVTVDLLFRDGTINGSLNGNTGVIHANVGPGNMGNQANALSLAVSFAQDGVALSEADLGQFNTFNRVSESDAFGDAGIGVGITKSASVVGSISGNAGIVGVNVTSGNFANQANVVSFSAVQL